MKSYAAFVFFIVTSTLSFGQLNGVVTDEVGNPLPYVSIYIQNTSTGTTTNGEGKFEFNLSAGEYQLNFRFIGYETIQKQISIGDKAEYIEIIMRTQATLLNEVVITADAEDPAYAIIRNAIKKRSFYKAYFRSYSCDVYVKGNQKIANVPESFMGEDVGDLEGALDSNRQGIVYLSESISQLHVDGDRYKEIVTSSKISGDDQGYSFNSAQGMNYNFYENTITFGRQIVTPIADNALNYYSYRLDGMFKDEDGRLINEISVIPKRSSDPVFAGTIFIVEDEWSIQALKLILYKDASKIYVMDSLIFNQVYIPIHGTEGQVLFSNTIAFAINIFGVQLDGFFGANFSNYNTTPNFEDDFFDEYVHVVEEKSNTRDSTYWEEIRPIPLTSEESIDYIRRDSIHKVRIDPVYLDSVDRENNKFRFSNLMGGYRHTRQSKHLSYEFSSPLTGIGFNAVQGYSAKLDFELEKFFDDNETNGLTVGVEVGYGFSEKKLRASGFLSYRPSLMNVNRYTLRGGSEIVQFNREEPISNIVNSLYSLFLKDNYARYYDLKHIQFEFRHEPWSGIMITHGLSWEDRSPLTNHSDYSFFHREEPYNPNELAVSIEDGIQRSFDRHQALLLDMSIRLRFHQKYILFPGRRFTSDYRGPEIVLGYKGAFATGGGDASFHRVEVSINDQWKLGVGGRLQLFVNSGKYLASDRLNLPDYKYFMGNEAFFTKESGYRGSFLMMPYYELGTGDSYLQVHLQHHFDGWILDKIPFLQMFGWNLVAGVKHLRTTENSPYSELHLGIDNIGYKFLRLIRIDGVLSSFEGDTRFGVRMNMAF